MISEIRIGVSDVNSAQKTVAIGAASGIAIMVLLLTALSTVIPPPADVVSMADRLAFALKCDLFALAPLVLMLAGIANGRFRTAAIDPLAGRETRAQIINGRVADNTLEQYLLFLVGTLTLSTLLAPKFLPTLLAASLVFALARLAFWFGYRMDPLYRAPGMAATVILNVAILGAAVIMAVLK
jgi:hypothetical protein